MKPIVIFFLVLQLFSNAWAAMPDSMSWSYSKELKKGRFMHDGSDKKTYFCVFVSTDFQVHSAAIISPGNKSKRFSATLRPHCFWFLKSDIVRAFTSEAPFLPQVGLDWEVETLDRVYLSGYSIVFRFKNNGRSQIYCTYKGANIAMLEGVAANKIAVAPNSFSEWFIVRFDRSPRDNVECAEKVDRKTITFKEAQRLIIKSGDHYGGSNGATKSFKKSVSYLMKIMNSNHHASFGGQVYHSLGNLYRKGDETLPVNKRIALEWFRKGTLVKCHWCSFYYGDMYRDGEGTDKDEKKAMEIYASVSWHGLAQMRMANIHFDKQEYNEAFSWYLAAAEQGDEDADSQYRVGYMYYEGKGVEKNNIQAYTWLKKSAEQGHAGSQKLLAEMYYYGEGVEGNNEQAFKWYYAAAEQGGMAEEKDAVYQYRLGYLYFHGEGVEQNYSEALTWFQKAAEQGDANAQNYLGRMYFKGEGVQKDLEKSFRFYRSLAFEGDVRGQRVVGYFYSEGKGVEQSYEKAFAWFYFAAEQGGAEDQFRLAVLCEDGRGVKQDLAQAAEWYLKAAEQGKAKAQTALGRMYLNGEGVQRDLGESIGWYRLAAENGDDEAQQRLAGKYYIGKDGVDQDFVQAYKWFHALAKKGDDDGQFSIGYMHATGKGVEQDWGKALMWYRKAAEQDNEPAQHELGKSYEFGLGVEKNKKKADEWYRLSKD